MSYTVTFQLDMGDLGYLDATAHGVVEEGDTIASTGRISIEIKKVVAQWPTLVTKPGLRKPVLQYIDVDVTHMVSRYCVTNLEEMIEQQYLNAKNHMNTFDYDRVDLG